MVEAHVNALLARFAPSHEPPLRVRDASVFARALTPRLNERLEFLGDAVLYLVVASYLHTRYPTQQEGMLTQLRQRLVQGRTLAALCRRHAQLGDLARRVGLRAAAAGDASDAAHEDAFEAFVGALHEDQGYDGARAWVVGFLEATVDFAQLVAARNDPKDVLNRVMRASEGHAPSYEVLARAPPGSGGKGGSATVRIRGRDGAVLATGAGRDVGAAERSAARKALQVLGHVRG